MGPCKKHLRWACPDCDVQPDEGAIDRVILQDEVQLYRARVVLAVLDGPVFDFGPTTVEFPDGPVPVFADDGRTQLGFASVAMELGNGHFRLMADLSIDYACEERLLAETRSRQIYPRLYGKLSVAAIPLFDFQAPLVPTKLLVQGIVLSRRRPADERIVALGEPVL